MISEGTIKLIVIGASALILFGGGTYAVHTYKEAVVRAEAAELAAAEADRIASRWKRDYDIAERDYREADRLAAERARRLGETNRRMGELAAQLANSARSDPVVRAFIDTPVPDGVRRLRREKAGCAPDPAVPCPAVAPATDSGASNAGRDRQRAPAGIPGIEGSSAELKQGQIGGS